jgi:hypothetical protein
MGSYWVNHYVNSYKILSSFHSLLTFIPIISDAIIDTNYYLSDVLEISSGSAVFKIL